ncbi:MAG: 2-oxoglutarate dehydrogenase E1 component, partial [Thermoanaerobaculia bacterium]
MGTSTTDERVAREAAVLQMINAYRVRGHLLADLDPLEYKVGHHAELNPQYYDLTIWDFDRQFICGGLCAKPTAKLRDILDTLRETYCGHIGAEYMHISDPPQRAWIQDRIEGREVSFTPEGKKAILKKLMEAEIFERFIDVKYTGTKRFGLDGAEGMIPALEQIIKRGGALGVKEIV